MRIELCDERGGEGFSWIVDDAMTRTSHALAAEGRVWLVDPVRFRPALERAQALGTPAAVLQLLDRHNRDCGAIAAELGVPHHVAPDSLEGGPFEAIPVRRARRWRETALWWPATRTLVVAEAIGTNPFFAPPGEHAGVHLLLRLSPPRETLRDLEPEHLLVGHGRGVHGPEATRALVRALDRSRRDVPRILPRIPAFAVDALRRRR